MIELAGWKFKASFHHYVILPPVPKFCKFKVGLLEDIPFQIAYKKFFPCFPGMAYFSKSRKMCGIYCIRLYKTALRTCNVICIIIVIIAPNIETGCPGFYTQTFHLVKE